MKLERLEYRVEAEVRFTKQEVDYLINRAKTHYDHTCQMYGCAIGEMGATKNGVLAQLKMFPRDKGSAKHVLTSRELDTMLKILEFYRGKTDEKLRSSLFTKINYIFNIMQDRYTQLQKEEALVQR